MEIAVQKDIAIHSAVDDDLFASFGPQPVSNACTGQVYLPIIYSIQQGKMDAVAWLAAYNVAFILPLAVIFVMAITGMSNKRLIDFQQRHTFGW